MRVSDSMIASAIVARLSATSARLFRLQEQVASGLAFTTPSQNPTGAVRAAALRSSIAEIARYRSNARTAGSQLRLAEVSLASISERLLDARTTALAMGDTDQAGNEALADHAHEILSQIVRDVSLASEGRYLFSGHKVLTAPVAENPAGSPPYLYQGDQGAMLVQLGRGVTVKANLNAAEVLNLGGVADPALDDVLDAIQKLETALRAGDREGVTGPLTSIEVHSNRVLAFRAEIGARTQHIHLAEAQLQTTMLTLQDLLSEVKDVDIAQAVIDLRSQEITYQAAAAAASALHRASLLDYMR